MGLTPMKELFAAGVSVGSWEGGVQARQLRWAESTYEERVHEKRI